MWVHNDGVQHSESLGLWTLSIVRSSKYLENTTFRKLDLFPSQGEERGTPLLGPLERLAFSKGPSRVEVSLPSPEDGRWGFHNTVELFLAKLV
jgi:hypothetical protein